MSTKMGDLHSDGALPPWRLIVKNTFIERVDWDAASAGSEGDIHEYPPPMRRRSSSDSELLDGRSGEEIPEPRKIPDGHGENMKHNCDCGEGATSDAETLSGEDRGARLPCYSYIRDDTPERPRERSPSPAPCSPGPWRHEDSCWAPVAFPFTAQVNVGAARPLAPCRRGRERDTSRGRVPAEAAPAPDCRSTVVLHGVPGSCTRAELLAVIDGSGFAGQYDFVYLPIDFRFEPRTSLGHAIVNFVSALEAARFWDTFTGSSPWAGRSGTTCTVSWSGSQQGLAANVERYRNSPVMHEAVPDECKPAVFDGGARVPFPPPTKKLRAPRKRHITVKGTEAAGAKSEWR